MDNQPKEISVSLNLGLTIDELISITKGTLRGKGPTNIKTTILTTDSRRTEPGAVFAALRGERFDGHQYIETAFSKGATVAIADTEPSAIPNDKYVIMVEDTVTALNDIAEYRLSKLNIPVAAITGSVGKTTTKELLSSILSRKYHTYKTDKNNNNEIGMPMTVLSCPDTAQVLVLEMGMMAIGDIELLSLHAHPQVAIITNIGMAHIGFPTLGSKEKIKEAKLEILKGMSPSGTIVLNGDDPMLLSERGKTGVREIFFSIDNEDCPVRAENIVLHSCDSEFDIIDSTSAKTQSVHVRLPIAGRQMIYNALAAYCAASVLGISPQDAAIGISELTEKGVHMKMYDRDQFIIIDDCYNASPDSVKSSLSVLANMEASGRKIAVLGDMLGYGDYTEDVHLDVGRRVSELGIDELFTYGAYAELTAAGAARAGMNEKNIHIFKCSMTSAPLESKGMKVNRAFEYEDKKSELARGINDIIGSGDIILFKASRNIYLETAITELDKIRQL